MRTPPIPNNESERLAALQALRLLDSDPEERFDRLARMAKRMFEVPIALVSLVDENRQWFKSKFGIEQSETSRDISFCGHAINGTETLVIANAKTDVRFADNPLVLEEPHIAFYAGTPIRTQNGFAIGTLCILDQVPRLFRTEDIELLEDLARLVENEIHAIQLATIDELTEISNRRGFYMVAEHSLSLAHRNKQPATMAMIDLDKFKDINDNWGHAEGDYALRRFAAFMQDFFRDADLVGRLGGDEFAVLLLNTDLDAAQHVMSKFESALDGFNQKMDKPYRLEFSFGLGTFNPKRPMTIRQLVENVDKRMYQQKYSKAPLDKGTD